MGVSSYDIQLYWAMLYNAAQCAYSHSLKWKGYKHFKWYLLIYGWDHTWPTLCLLGHQQTQWWLQLYIWIFHNIFWLSIYCLQFNIGSGNTWTIVDLSSVRSTNTHSRAISQEIPQPPITRISLNISYLKLHSNFQGANGLTNLNRCHYAALQ